MIFRYPWQQKIIPLYYAIGKFFFWSVTAGYNAVRTTSHITSSLQRYCQTVVYRSKPFKTSHCRCLAQLVEYHISERCALVHIPAELAFRSLKWLRGTGQKLDIQVFCDKDEKHRPILSQRLRMSPVKLMERTQDNNITNKCFRVLGTLLYKE